MTSRSWQKAVFSALAFFVLSQVQFPFFFDSELLVELMARSIWCSRLKRKERNHRPMVLLRKYGHRWLIPSRHYRTWNPLSIALFSGEESFFYPGLFEGKKRWRPEAGEGQCQFFVFKSSSVSLTPSSKVYIIKSSAKKEHIPLTKGRFGIVREPL